jgi:MerR family transcriptional regulator/heat shock protein HspR
MSRKYLRITEVIELCCVNEDFILRLEQESLIAPIVRDSQKLYPAGEVDRIRVARLLIEDMGVNFEGAEVALHMREQMIATQRQFNKLFRRLSQELKKQFFLPVPLFLLPLVERLFHSRPSSGTDFAV